MTGLSCDDGVGVVGAAWTCFGLVTDFCPTTPVGRGNVKSELFRPRSGTFRGKSETVLRAGSLCIGGGGGGIIVPLFNGDLGLAQDVKEGRDDLRHAI